MSLNTLSDSAFLTVSKNAHDVMDANIAAYPGVTPTMLNALNTKNTDLEGTLTAHLAAQSAARAATAAKDLDRDEADDVLRSIRNITKASGASDGAMAALQLPTSGPSAPSTITVPRGAVDTSRRMQHVISWTDSATPDNKKRPAGTMGAEIWVKIDGPPPTDESQCHFLTMDSATPYLAEYSGDEGGKTAHYLLRWRNRDGSTSSWSETVSATITA